MADTAIHTHQLRKTFGEVRALAGLDLEVRSGEVLGFIGPNGAGKSTTIRILMDLLRPSGGEVAVLGIAPSAGGPALRARIGYLPGELHLTGNRTAGAVLAHLARLRGGRGVAHIPALAQALQLDLDRPVRGLSKGNKQKIGVVQAFMHQPELLVLDEPTSGLDPLLQQVFLDLVRQARDRGATVLMSSHVLSEVEDCADRVAIIRDGRLIDVDDVAVLRRRAGQAVELSFAEPVDPASFTGLPGVTDVVVEPADGRSGRAPTGDGSVLRCVVHGEPDELLKAAARHHVTGWQARDRDLEELFLDAYRTGSAASAPALTATEVTP